MKVGSDLLAIYLKTEKSGATYNRVGSNVESCSINMNPTENEYGDITKSVKTTDLESYKPSIEGTGKYEQGDDPIYDLFLGIYREKKVLSDALFDVLIVHRWQENSADLYEKSTVIVNSINLTGAESLEVDFAIRINAAPKKGTATVSADDDYMTATFTPA